MRGRISIVLLVASMLLGGCGKDDPTGPDLPSLPGPGSDYDGLWRADISPLDYPARGLRFEIQEGALVHVYLDSFWDLAQCDQGFTNTRFDPPSPVPVRNGFVTVAQLQAGPLAIESMTVWFDSPTTSTGSVTFSLDQGGPCVADAVTDGFAAER